MFQYELGLDSCLFTCEVENTRIYPKSKSPSFDTQYNLTGFTYRRIPIGVFAVA